MRKGCLLGILKKGMPSYSSPIMLIPRKLTGIPRIVTDFRYLNNRLITLQPSILSCPDIIFSYAIIVSKIVFKFG